MPTLPWPWPPQRDDFFDPPDKHRPVWQGDVFRKVPFGKVRPNPEGRRPLVDYEPKDVVVLGYPCEMYEGTRLVDLQVVALVQSAKAAGVPEDFFQRRTPPGAYGTCPFPDVFADRTLWVADFRVITIVSNAELTLARRTAALSEYGLAYFRQRIAVGFTRVSPLLSVLEEADREQWVELELWTLWNQQGRTDDFQKWMGQFDPSLGAAPRDLLERGQFTTLRAYVTRGGAPTGP